MKLFAQALLAAALLAGCCAVAYRAGYRAGRLKGDCETLHGARDSMNVDTGIPEKGCTAEEWKLP